MWVAAKELDYTGKQKWTVAIDCRRLNENTIDDIYPLPNINNLLDKLGRRQYFALNINEQKRYSKNYNLNIIW